MKTFKLIDPNTGRVISVKGDSLEEAQYNAATKRTDNSYWPSDYKKVISNKKNMATKKRVSTGPKSRVNYKNKRKSLYRVTEFFGTRRKSKYYDNLLMAEEEMPKISYGTSQVLYKLVNGRYKAIKKIKKSVYK